MGPVWSVSDTYDTSNFNYSVPGQSLEQTLEQTAPIMASDTRLRCAPLPSLAERVDAIACMCTVFVRRGAQIKMLHFGSAERPSLCSRRQKTGARLSAATATVSALRCRTCCGISHTFESTVTVPPHALIMVQHENHENVSLLCGAVAAATRHGTNELPIRRAASPSAQNVSRVCRVREFRRVASAFRWQPERPSGVQT